MKVFVILFLIGLVEVAVANENHENKHHVHRHHEGKHHKRLHFRDEETSPTPCSESPSPSQPATTQPSAKAANQSFANYEGLNLLFISEKKSLGFANLTENVALYSLSEDNESHLTLAVDSKTGVILRYQSLKNISLIQNKELSGDILAVLAKIILKHEDQTTAGNSSEVQPSSEEALSLISEVYLHLGHAKVKGDNHFRNPKFIKILLKKIVGVFYGGPLNGLITGHGPVPLKQNLNRFLTITVGLRRLFTAATGGLKAILAKNVKFDLNSLFNSKNGVEVFSYIMRQTGTKFDLGALWGSLLTDIEELLEIIQQLGGGEGKNNVDETFAVLSHIISAIKLRISFPDLVRFLLEATSEEKWNTADDGDLEQVLQDLKGLADDQSRKYNSSALTSVVSFLTNFTANNLIYKDCNVSSLIEKWKQRDVIGGLKVVTHISLKIFNPETYSTYLFNGFTAFLNSSSDPEALKRLLPGISTDEFLGKNGSLLNSLTKSHDLDNILKNGGNANEILHNIPAFGEFSKILKDASGSPFDFSKILKGNTFSEYVSKLFASPGKWGFDGFAHFIEGPIKQIFWNPIQHFIPGGNFLSLVPTGIPNIEQSSSEKSSTKKDSDDDEDEIKSTASSTKSSDEKETENLTLIPSTESDEKEKSTKEELATKKDDETIKLETVSSTKVSASTEFSFKHHHNKHHAVRIHHHQKVENEKHAERHHHSRHHHHNRKHPEHPTNYENRHQKRSHHIHVEEHLNEKNEKLNREHKIVLN